MRSSRTWGAYWSSVRPEDRESGIQDRDARLALFSPRFWTVSKENDPFHEPLVTYAYLAGVTKKLGLATGVIILPQRQTACPPSRRRTSTCSRTAGCDWASGSAGTG